MRPSIARTKENEDLLFRLWPLAGILSVLVNRL
jgi:hypothetical protein